METVFTRPQHHVEPELHQPGPRPIRRRPGRGTLVGFVHFFILPHTVVGIGALLWALHGFLLLLGPIVPATVTQRETSRSSKGRISYFVSYAFQADGQTRHDRASVSYEFYAGAEKGDRVPVQIPLAGPALDSVLCVDAWATATDVAQRWFFTLIWDAVMTAFWWFLWVLPLAYRSLVANGRATVGRVTRRQVMRGKGTSYYLHYEFTVDGGLPRSGRMQVRSEQFHDVREGDYLTVLYSPQRPRFSVLYAYADYEVAT